MAELSVEELAKVLPQRLAGRIKDRYPTVLSPGIETKNQKLTTNSSLISSPPPRRGRAKVGVLLNTNDQRLTTILEISQHCSDRIIFEGKEIKVTARGFSLLYLLAQHKKEVVSYNNILDEIWKDDEDAIYTRIIQHIYKFRRDILDAIGNNKKNKEKVKDIFKVVSGRGVMLNINDQELQIN